MAAGVCGQVMGGGEVWASREGWRGHRDQLGELSEVLSGGGEVELISGAVGTSQAEPAEVQDAFEVAKSISTFFLCRREVR